MEIIDGLPYYTFDELLKMQSNYENQSKTLSLYSIALRNKEYNENSKNRFMLLVFYSIHSHEYYKALKRLKLSIENHISYIEKKHCIETK